MLAVCVPECWLVTVADPGDPGPLSPVKTSKKNMATVPRCKFRESLGLPSDKFLDPLVSDLRQCNITSIRYSNRHSASSHQIEHKCKITLSWSNPGKTVKLDFIPNGIGVIENKLITTLIVMDSIGTNRVLYCVHRKWPVQVLYIGFVNQATKVLPVKSNI